MKSSHKNHEHQCSKCEETFYGVPSQHHQCIKCSKCGPESPRRPSRCKHFRCRCPYCGRYFSYNNRGVQKHLEKPCPQLLPHNDSMIINNTTPMNSNSIAFNRSSNNNPRIIYSMADASHVNINSDDIIYNNIDNTNTPETSTPSSNSVVFSSDSFTSSPSPISFQHPSPSSQHIHNNSGFPTCYIQFKGARSTPDGTRLMVNTSSTDSYNPIIVQLSCLRINDDIIRNYATHWKCSFDPSFTNETEHFINESISKTIVEHSLSAPLHICFCVYSSPINMFYPLCMTSIHMDIGPRSISTRDFCSRVSLLFQQYHVSIDEISPQHLNLHDTNTKVTIYGSFPLVLRSAHQVLLCNDAQPINCIPVHPRDVAPHRITFQAPQMSSPTTLQVRLNIQNFGLTDSYMDLHYYHPNDNHQSINITDFDYSNGIFNNNSNNNNNNNNNNNHF